MITKVQENRLRRAARRQGYELIKSRVREQFNPEWGRYQLKGWVPVQSWMRAEVVAELLHESLDAPSKPQFVPHRYRKETP